MNMFSQQTLDFLAAFDTLFIPIVDLKRDKDTEYNRKNLQPDCKPVLLFQAFT